MRRSTRMEKSCRIGRSCNRLHQAGGMVAPTFLRMQTAWTLGLALALAVALGRGTPAADLSRQSAVAVERATAEALSNRSFQLQYDASGITSLKRTGDV